MPSVILKPYMKCLNLKFNACKKSVQWLYLSCFIYQDLASTGWVTGIHQHTERASTSLIRISFLWSWMLRLCCCQPEPWGVGACSPDASRGVRPLRLIRLIRGSNLADVAPDSALHEAEQWEPTRWPSVTQSRAARACLLPLHTDMWTVRYSGVLTVVLCVCFKSELQTKKRTGLVGAFSDLYGDFFFFLFYPVFLM